MFEVHFSISDNILTMSLGSSFFSSGAFITHWLKRFTFHFYSYLKHPLNRPLDRKWIGRASEEQAKNVPKIFPTNEIARNKICSADLLNGHEWRKVGCVVEKNLNFVNKYLLFVRIN
jgi:hypothetical protein